jgi:hypothetical protein
MRIRQARIAALAHQVRNKPPKENQKASPKIPQMILMSFDFLLFRHLYILGKGSPLTFTILNRIRGKGNRQTPRRRRRDVKAVGEGFLIGDIPGLEDPELIGFLERANQGAGKAETGLLAPFHRHRRRTASLTTWSHWRRHHPDGFAVSLMKSIDGAFLFGIGRLIDE